MDNSQLAAKHKRILEWRDFLEVSSVPQMLRDQISNTLEVYAKILTDCWKKGSCSPELSAQLSDLERELEMLNESIRLSAATTLSREFEK